MIQKIATLRKVWRGLERRTADQWMISMPFFMIWFSQGRFLEGQFIGIEASGFDFVYAVQYFPPDVPFCLVTFEFPAG